jgi:acyl CoA:acetate/3-ketoacid CoA transferase alpha subunit
MNKTYATVKETIEDIKDGAVIGIGGFFAAGVPRTLLDGLIEKGTKDLIICCGSGPHSCI